MTRFGSLVLGSTLLISPFVHAADDRFAVAGPGATSCGKWIEARALQRKEVDAVLTTWIQGFLSGMNTQRLAHSNQEVSLIPDPPTLLAYVDKACRDNPLDQVYLIAIKLYQDMQK